MWFFGFGVRKAHEQRVAVGPEQLHCRHIIGTTKSFHPGCPDPVGVSLPSNASSSTSLAQCRTRGEHLADDAAVLGAHEEQDGRAQVANLQIRLVLYNQARSGWTVFHVNFDSKMGKEGGRCARTFSLARGEHSPLSTIDGRVSSLNDIGLLTATTKWEHPNDLPGNPGPPTVPPRLEPAEHQLARHSRRAPQREVPTLTTCREGEPVPLVVAGLSGCEAPQALGLLQVDEDDFLSGALARSRPAPDHSDEYRDHPGVFKFNQITAKRTSDALPSDTQSRHASQSEILGSARSSLQSFYTANTSLSQSSTTQTMYRNSTASSNLSFPYTVRSINSYKSRKNVLYPRRAHPPPVTVTVSPEFVVSSDLIWDVRYLCATLLPQAETRLVPAATVLLRCLPVGPQGDLSQGPPNMNDDTLRCSESFLVLTREVFLRDAAGAEELEGPCELLHETFRDILFKSGAFVPRPTSNFNAIDLRASLAEAEDFERVIRVLRALCSVMDAFEGALNAAKLPAASDEALRERQRQFLPTLSISEMTMGQYRKELGQKLFRTQARFERIPRKSDGLPHLSASGISIMRPYSRPNSNKVDLDVTRGDTGDGSRYGARGPMANARGLVTRDTLEASNEDATPNPRNSQALSRPLRTPSAQTPLPSATFKTQEFYAVVLHDFIAERPDELDAKAGDPILVVAQSTREWFVGKPIGRLGTPGLIPVSFVEVRDPASGKPIPDVGALMDNGTLPRVEDWKKQLLSYRSNSIALGVFEDPLQTPVVINKPPSPLPDGVLLRETSSYYRAYNDFFDFQVALLETFPREGGRERNDLRVIPFMPGPTLSLERLTGLDDYLRRLCRLNRTTARYILEHHLTREFFALKPGDIENDTDPQYDRMAEIGWYDPSDEPEPVSMNDLPSLVDDVVEKFQKTSIRSNGAWEQSGCKRECRGTCDLGRAIGIQAFIKIKVFDRIQDDLNCHSCAPARDVRAAARQDTAAAGRTGRATVVP
ncbi:hypothetical protein H4582DRAFT_2124508 [Lactarius indigo]|nr:hypothetical protein H4582DRAFT_2124508 [Lactarius indigo]